MACRMSPPSRDASPLACQAYDGPTTRDKAAMSSSHQPRTSAGRESASEEVISREVADLDGCWLRLSTSAMLGRHSRETPQPRSPLTCGDAAMSDDERSAVDLEVLEAQLAAGASRTSRRGGHGCRRDGASERG